MKKYPSARKFLFLLSLLSALPWGVLAGTEGSSARQQIYRQAANSAEADIRRIAQARQWQGHNSKLNVFIPSEVSQFRRCSVPLTVSRPQGNSSELTRFRYDLRCEDASGWEVSVTVKPDVYLPVLVARRALDRGTQLAASDLILKKKNISAIRDGVLIHPDDAVGLTVKKRIRPLQPIMPSQLEQPVLVERGQRVLMLAEQQGVQAKMIGEALKKGRKGDTIRVKNLSSERTVSALVESSGVVRMLLPPTQ